MGSKRCINIHPVQFTPVELIHLSSCNFLWFFIFSRWSPCPNRNTITRSTNRSPWAPSWPPSTMRSPSTPAPSTPLWRTTAPPMVVVRNPITKYWEDLWTGQTSPGGWGTPNLKVGNNNRIIVTECGYLIILFKVVQEVGLLYLNNSSRNNLIINWFFF